MVRAVTGLFLRQPFALELQTFDESGISGGDVDRNVTLLAAASCVICLHLLPAVGGCSAGSPSIEIKGQEAVLSPAIKGVCSVYMSIENSGDGDDILLTSRADIPWTMTQLHDVRDGKMVRREKIPVPARGVLKMKPGSLHIMVINLPKGTGVGYEFTLRLVFKKSGEKVTSVRVVR
jgi:copper(I)-binding protein